MNTNTEIKTRQQRQVEQWPNHPGNALAPWARLKLADAEIADLRAEIARLQAALAEREAKQVQWKLPPLPEPVDEIAAADGFNVLGCQDVFTADQMQAYARAAIAQRVGCVELLGYIGYESRERMRQNSSAHSVCPAIMPKPDDVHQPAIAVYTTPPAAVTDADKRDAEHANSWREWHAMCRRVDSELPEGWLITYEMGPDMWGISLSDPDGNNVEFKTCDCESDAEMVICALDAAIAASAKEAK